MAVARVIIPEFPIYSQHAGLSRLIVGFPCWVSLWVPLTGRGASGAAPATALAVDSDSVEACCSCESLAASPLDSIRMIWPLGRGPRHGTFDS